MQRRVLAGQHLCNYAGTADVHVHAVQHHSLCVLKSIPVPPSRSPSSFSITAACGVAARSPCARFLLENWGLVAAGDALTAP